MKFVLLTAAVLSLMAAAWAVAGSRPAAMTYAVEVRETAGAESFTVTPEVTVNAAGHLVMPEVVCRASRMPEVVVRAYPEVAHVPGSGFLD